MREVRTLRAVPTADDSGVMHGLAAPFNQKTKIGTGKYSFREKLAPGAWAKSIQDGDIVLLDNHDQSKPMARMSAGSLTVRETDRGAEWEATPADTSYARDAQANVRAGNYGGCSFGFECVRDSWEIADDGVEERTLHEIKVYEISTVTFPAYTGTDVAMRSAYDAAMEARGPKPYGDVEYADPKNGKYPIDTKAHAKAAWSYINQADNAAKYPMNGVTLSSVKARIKAACAKFGIDVSEAKSDGHDGAETRDDPDGMEYACIDHAVALLKKGNVDGALTVLQHNQKNRTDDSDAPGDDDTSAGKSSGGRSRETPTSAEAKADDALRLARFRELSRARA